MQYIYYGCGFFEVEIPIYFENFRARLALPLSRRSFRGLLIKSKNKSVQITPKMKS